MSAAVITSAAAMSAGTARNAARALDFAIAANPHRFGETTEAGMELRALRNALATAAREAHATGTGVAVRADLVLI